MALDERVDADFASVLRDAITASELTLRDLRAALDERGAPVSLSSLSTWQSGTSRPERRTSLRVVEQLEDVLGLPAGRLREALGPRSARTRPGRGEPLLGADSWPMPQRISRLLHALDSTPLDPRQPGRLTHRITQHVGPDLNPVRADHSLVVRAGPQGASRFFKLSRYGPWCRPPRVSDTHGMRMHRFRGEPSTGHAAFELALVPELGPHATGLLEFSEHEPPGSEERSIDIRVQPGLQHLVLETWFRADHLPTEVAAFFRATLRSPVRCLGRLQGDQVTARWSLVRVDPEPGIYGMRWR